MGAVLRFDPIETEQECVIVERVVDGVPRRFELRKDAAALVGMRLALLTADVQRASAMAESGSDETRSAEDEEAILALWDKIEARTLALLHALWVHTYPGAEVGEVARLLPHFAERWAVLMDFFSRPTPTSSPRPSAGATPERVQQPAQQVGDRAERQTEAQHRATQRRRRRSKPSQTTQLARALGMH